MHLQTQMMGTAAASVTQITERLSTAIAQGSIERLAGISEVNSTSTLEITTISEEFAVQVEEVGGSSNVLFDIATELQNAMTSFKIDPKDN